MLSSLLATNPRRFDALAAAWLADGATGFAVWGTNRLLARWGDGDTAAPEALAAPIGGARQPMGELRVLGMLGPSVCDRLAAEAELIAQLARAENDVEEVTADLVEVQDQLLALYRLERSAASALQLDECLRTLAREAAGLLKAEAAFVGLLSQSDIPPTFRADGSPGPVLQPDVYRRLIVSKHEQSVVAEEPGALGPGIDNVICVPVSIRDAVIAGVLGLINRSTASLGSPDLKLIRAVAAHTGAVTERALLYQERVAQMRVQTEMELAREVQRRLLPTRPPTVAGLDIFARALPALHVGGDFYDFVIPPGRPLFLALGDVTGKGLAAALLTTMVRTVLRSKVSFMSHPSPLQVITRANEDLYDDFTEVGMFATVFVGQYEQGKRMLRFANAGHAPVIYRSCDSPARLIEAEGVPMGVLRDSLCAEQAIPLRPGDLLVVASDGFHEARNPSDEMFGIERLLNLIDQHTALSAAELGAALYDAVEHFSSDRTSIDDRTLIVIKGVPAV